MATTREQGRYTVGLACQFLENKGFRLIEKNIIADPKNHVYGISRTLDTIEESKKILKLQAVEAQRRGEAGVEVEDIEREADRVTLSREQTSLLNADPKFNISSLVEKARKKTGQKNQMDELQADFIKTSPKGSKTCSDRGLPRVFNKLRSTNRIKV